MPSIKADNELCTVIVTVDGTAEAIARILDHATEGLSAFAGFKGFRGGATHRSSDGRRLVQYLQWDSEADHLACIGDPCWDKSPSSRQFKDMMEVGDIAVDMRTYLIERSTD